MPDSAGDLDAIQSYLLLAACLLPQQAPLHRFVYQNPLQQLETVPFEDAVHLVENALKANGYLNELEYGQHIKKGRIQAEDLEQVVASAPDACSERKFGLPSRDAIRLSWLKEPFAVPEGQWLVWHLQEGNWSDEQKRWWTFFKAHDSGENSTPRTMSWRQSWDEQCRLNAQIAPLLIRFCAAYLDQGTAYLAMPRKDGLFASFCHLYGQAFGPPYAWAKGFSSRLQQLEQSNAMAPQVILDQLTALGVPKEEWSSYLLQATLVLPGFAGMVHQLHNQPDLAPTRRVEVSLADFVAMVLVLDRQIIESCPKRPNPINLSPATQPSVPFMGMVLAGRLKLLEQQLHSAEALAYFRAEIETFDVNRRRQMLHQAFEQRYYDEALNALSKHIPVQKPRAKFQAVFCIDEREESFRRYLESYDPSIHTYAYAGFFGVAMAYQGVEDIRAMPYCPVVQTPKHLVKEELLSNDERFGRNLKRAFGRATHFLGVSNKTFLRGGILTAVLGVLSVVSLLGRCLFPRQYQHLLEAKGPSLFVPPTTRLLLERTEINATQFGLYLGYTPLEMADVVANVLTTTRLSDALAPLVLIVGHGSSSLNNPHEAAYHCGATGGARGGYNARAFAQMANHPEVRRILAGRNINLGESWFVGAYHDTCNDSLLYHDTHLVPFELKDVLLYAEQAFAEAAKANAHERCRRFLEVPQGISEDAALAQVELRSYDLSQPRPEYCAATNALCVVGPRALTEQLFLDRRAFLVSYDCRQDPDGTNLAQLLPGVVPVCVGINLQYYFGCTDQQVFGSGTKLPHNITSLLGVMDGHASDLRVGLHAQSVEIHEPLRLLCVIEGDPWVVQRAFEQHENIRRMVHHHWLRLCVMEPQSKKLWLWERTQFVPFEAKDEPLHVVPSWRAFYQGCADNMAFARLTPEELA